SGSGKTRLALALIAETRRCGHFASLIGDDRIGLESAPDGLIMHPHPQTQGQAEQRGLGIVDYAYEPAAVLHYVIDLVDISTISRMPTPDELTISLKGRQVPRLKVGISDPLADKIQQIFMFLLHYQ